MAEFVQTVKDWQRMCSVCTCSNKEEMKDFPLCPIITQHMGCPCDECPQDWSEEATKQFEEIVTAWAAEHPEPVYPTWREWLLEMGVLRKRMLCDDVAQIETDMLKECSPIPADIAEKLGLKPKEG